MAWIALVCLLSEMVAITLASATHQRAGWSMHATWVYYDTSQGTQPAPDFCNTLPEKKLKMVPLECCEDAPLVYGNIGEKYGEAVRVSTHGIGTCLYDAGRFSNHARVAIFAACQHEYIMYGELCHDGDNKLPGYTGDMSGYPFPPLELNAGQDFESIHFTSPHNPHECGCGISNKAPYGFSEGHENTVCSKGCRRVITMSPDTCYRTTDPGEYLITAGVEKTSSEGVRPTPNGRQVGTQVDPVSANMQFFVHSKGCTKLKTDKNPPKFGKHEEL